MVCVYVDHVSRAAESSVIDGGLYCARIIEPANRREMRGETTC